MARYWIGGTGNITDTAHWSDTSGGTGGFSAPGSTDSVFYDANSVTSGSQTITFNASQTWGSLDCTGVLSGTAFAKTNTMAVVGDCTFASGMSLGGNGGLNLGGSGTSNLTMNGISFSTSSAIVLAGSGTVNLQDALTIIGGGSFRPFSSGTFNTNNNALTAAAYQSNSGSCAQALGSSSITINGNTNKWLFSTGSLNAGTSTITFTASGGTFAGGGQTYYNVALQQTDSVTGTNTYNEFSVSAGRTISFSNNQTMTTLTAIGTAPSTITLKSNAAGTQRSLCVTTWNIAYVNFQDINASCSPIECCDCTDNGGNLNVDFCTSRAFLLSLV